jgi:anti-anti-sigma factor
MEIKVEQSDDMTVMSVTGKIDSAASQKFEDHIMSNIHTGQRRLILDFSGVEYVSSAGLRVILVGTHACRSAGGRLVLCGMTENIQDVFRISGLLTTLTVCNTIDEAKAAA